jgi:molecular chaperone HtpG
MVADRVEVASRRAGDDQAWVWKSDGKGEFTVAEGQREGRGTTVTLHLKADETEYLELERLKSIIRAYSDHIAIPIELDGEKANRGGALWARPKSDIKGEDYTEFYHHVGHAFDDPALTLHFKAEGKIEYTALLFVPSTKPFDLFDPVRRHRLKLYVKRVFITDECEGLAPAWLRFLRGIVDSEDLPLNVSRETLQANPVIVRIRQGLTRRVLSELAKKAEQDADGYAKVWDAFGAVLKEGLYEDSEYREELLKLARFRSTASDKLVSLEDYVARLRPNQEAIYTIAGDELEALKKSPQLEGFAARGIEVLLLTDAVDEFWTAVVPDYQGKAFRSATRAGAELGRVPLLDESKKPESEARADGATDALIALLKLTLKDEVKDVRASERLTESAVCLVSDESDPDMHLERLLKLHGQARQATKRILEINAGHALIRALAEAVRKDGAKARLDDAAFLLLDQARILEGETIPDPTAFARRMAAAMAKGLG